MPLAIFEESIKHRASILDAITARQWYVLQIYINIFTLMQLSFCCEANISKSNYANIEKYFSQPRQ